MKHPFAFPTVLCACLLCFCACKPKPVTPRPPLVSHFSECYIETYGQCYDFVPRNVVALDFYSDGLTLNEDHKMQGSGTNLYISDIFLDDADLHTLLGAFAASAPLLDTLHFYSGASADNYTFLPGMDFEGNPTGIYLLTISEGAIASIQVLDSGRFVLAQTADRLLYWQGTFYYTPAVAQGAKPVVQIYAADFQGIPDIQHRETAFSPRCR